MTHHIIVLFSFIFTFTNKRNVKYLFIFLIILLFLFSALRYGFGNDYFAYKEFHNQINLTRNNVFDLEFLFFLLNYLIPSFEFLIIVTSLFQIASIYFLIKNSLTKDLYLISILIFLLNPYLFFIQLSAIRQTLSIIFLIISTYYRTKDLILLPILFSCIAIGFHESSLIFLPVLFFLNNSKLAPITIITCVLFFFIIFFSNIYSLLISIITPYLSLNYLSYLAIPGNSIRATLITSFGLFLHLYYLNKIESNKRIYFKLAILSYLFYIAAFRSGMFTRFAMFFETFTIISIPSLIKYEKRYNLKILIIMIIFGIFILRYYSFFINPNWIEHYSNYDTIF
jgi:transmembrane protein EpsG